MSIFHDGCTAGPLSEWLTSQIGACCSAHDYGLDHSTDLATFLEQNRAFMECVGQTSLGPAVALILFLVVSSPLGWLLYRFGPKRRPE